MAVPMPAGVFLPAADCARLDWLLVRALRDLAMQNGAVPRDVELIAAFVHRAAVEFRASLLVEAGSGTSDDVSGSVARSLVSTERLSPQEAAALTGISDSYWRRLARRGDVHATRSGDRGQWMLDGGAVAARMADRTEARKAA
jgi:excisionase family DNA binding protein